MSFLLVSTEEGLSDPESISENNFYILLSESEWVAIQEFLH